MGKRGNHRLVARTGIDGLLLGVSEDQREAASAIAAQCGYDATHPHPFYGVEVAICLVRRLAATLYPEMSEADAQRQLGYACSKGYGDTISGMTALARTRTLKLGEALHYALEVMRRESSFVEYQISEISTRHYHVEVTNWPYHPNFLCGALTYTLEINGAERPACQATVLDEMSYAYELQWN